jgi:DNA-binding NarL/FixJ family response regulator
MIVRVLLVDDQAMVRTGFRLILESEPGIEVVGEAADGREALSAAREVQPDITLMDVQMPILDGLAATQQMLDDAEIHTRVVILTTFERDEYIFGALRAGASGFLLKNAPPEDLIEAIRIVAAGNALLAPSVTRRLIDEFTKRPSPRVLAPELGLLTERELETLRLLAQGLTNAEIAARLFVGESTVKTHVSNIFGKLSLRDRVQAVIFAYESGLALPGGSSPSGGN